MKFEAQADESVGLCRFLILISPHFSSRHPWREFHFLSPRDKGHSGITIVALACIHNQQHLIHFLYLQVVSGAKMGVLLWWFAM